MGEKVPLQAGKKARVRVIHILTLTLEQCPIWEVVFHQNWKTARQQVHSGRMNTGRILWGNRWKASHKRDRRATCSCLEKLKHAFSVICGFRRWMISCLPHPRGYTAICLVRFLIVTRWGERELWCLVSRDQGYLSTSYIYKCPTTMLYT